MSINPAATIEEAIFTLLQSLSPITDLVGTRVYPLQMPQNPTYPCLVYRLISDRSLDWVEGDGGMYWPRFQFDCFAQSYGQAKRLARTLRLQLSGYSGLVGEIDLCRISFLNEVDDFEPVAEVYRVAVEFRIQYK